MQAASLNGLNASKLQAAMDSVVRDKNQALDQLDKVGLREINATTFIASSGLI